MESKNGKIKRIALLGPESTAKSTLSEQLAMHYNTVWVKETAREYLSNIQHHYTLDDIIEIGKLQLNEEQKLISQANKFIFIDTEFINLKVWCLDVFKTCPTFISEAIPKNPVDLYLLTYPDIPWQPDPLRENPNRREFLFEWYENELKQLNIPYQIIKGKNQNRLNNCLNAITFFFGNK